MRISDWSSDVCSSDLCVRATIDQRKDLIVASAEHRDFLAAGNRNGAGSAHGDFVKAAHVEPFSREHFTYSAATGWNSAMCACCSCPEPFARSAQGSSCMKLCE